MCDDYIEAIGDRGKTIEMCLNDEKRSKIEIGDEIEFTSTKTNEVLVCEIIKIYKCNDFEDLYKSHNKISIG